MIARIRRAVGPRGLKPGRVILGIGDDASLLRIPEGHQAVVTTDFSIEGVHFRREWHPPESVGHRCLTRGLSDIAAMAAEPMAAFLSLAVPPRLPQAWIDQFLKGLLKLANQCGVTLAGGDTSVSSDGVLADIAVIGSVPKGTAILRSGARRGDRIYVTGELGGSAATLDLLLSGQKAKLQPAVFQKHFFPLPRIRVARVLRKKGIATSMIDISDGLSTDLNHMCEESGVGAELWEEAVPLSCIGKPAHEVDAEFAWHGGEDYELLFTASPRTRVPAQIAGIQITEIGCITRAGITLLHSNGGKSKLDPRGWEHFRQHSPDK